MNKFSIAATLFKLIPRFILIYIMVLPGSGCIKDQFDFDQFSSQINLNPSFATPLVYGSLKLSDIISQDDSLFVYNEDFTIQFVIREDSIISLQLREIIEIPNQDSIVNNFDLQPPLINDFEINTIIPLDSLVKYMDESLASQLASLNGQFAYFPAFAQDDLGEYWFDLIEDIDYVEFADGGLFISIANKLPVTMQQVIVELKNDFDNSVLATLSFSDINPDSSKTEYLELSDILMHSIVEARVAYLDVGGSFPEQVEINLDDYIELTIISDSIKVSKGRAVIPDQIIHQKNNMITLKFPDNEDVELTKLQIKSARLTYSLQLSSDETFLVKVKLPETTRNNSVVEFALNTTGSGGVINGWWDLNNTLSNLTSDSIQHFNKLPVDYVIEFISSGEKIDFDISEGVERFIDLTIDDVVFEYVEGYFGQTIINIVQEVLDPELDFLDKITGVSVFSGAVIKLHYEHNLGVPLGLFVNLTGFYENDFIELEHPDIFISGATSFGDAISDTILLDDNNSNITDFAALRPTRFSVTGNALTNPQGRGIQPNFIHESSYFNAGFEFVMPMSFQTLDIILVDTLEIDFRSDLTENLDNLIIYFQAWNGFPLNAIVDLTLYNSSEEINVHTFSKLALLSAAPVGENGIVPAEQQTFSQTEIVIPTEVLNQIGQVDYIIISAMLNNPGQEISPVKLLSTYSIDFKILSKLQLSL